MSDQAKIGSVISGTMRPQDVIPALLQALLPLDILAYNEFVELAGGSIIRSRKIKPLQLFYDITWEEDDAIFWMVDDVPDLLSELLDMLNDKAPPFCYFGAHEGNGSDFGFWVNIEAVEQAVTDGELLSFSDDLPDEIPENDFIVVNDHGNVSLYHVVRSFETVWEIV